MSLRDYLRKRRQVTAVRRYERDKALRASQNAGGATDPTASTMGATRGLGTGTGAGS